VSVVGLRGELTSKEQVSRKYPISQMLWTHHYWSWS